MVVSLQLPVKYPQLPVKYPQLPGGKKKSYSVYIFLPLQSVWGSYWKDGQWGYQCCHSLIKESYCTGSAGREAAGDSLSIMNTSPTHTAAHTEEEDEEEEAPPTSSMALPPVLLATPTEDRLQAEAPPPEAGTSTQEDGGQTEEVKQKSLMEVSNF